MIPVTRRILPAEEIAANAFTKAYLKLEFEPQELEEIYFKSAMLAQDFHYVDPAQASIQ